MYILWYDYIAVKVINFTVSNTLVAEYIFAENIAFENVSLCVYNTIIYVIISFKYWILNINIFKLQNLKFKYF